jgi:RHS repeat-associated protein
MPSPLTLRTAKTTVSGGLGYYPFGMMQEGRQFVGGMGYTWGFNGKENDDAIIGVGRWQDYGERMYRTDLGCFFSVDPFTSMYPFYSPYQFAGNKPIWKIDLDGLEEANPEMSKDRIQERVTELKIQYQKMISDARAVGANVAAANLQHFLDGSGSPKTLAASWLRSYSVIQQGEERLQGYFQERNITSWAKSMTVGQTVSKSDYWEAVIESYNPLNELSYASGKSNIRADGEFTLTRTGLITISISGTVRMKWNDPYDWHDGLDFWIPGSGFIDDKDALFLEKHGGAKSFQMESTWEYSFSGSYNILSGKWSDAKWEYKGQVDTPSGSSGGSVENERSRDQRRTREMTRRQ